MTIRPKLKVFLQINQKEPVTHPILEAATTSYLALFELAPQMKSLVSKMVVG